MVSPTWSLTRLFAAVFALALFSTAQVQSAPIHQYRLDGSYADDFGGPALTPNGGTLGATRYSFGGDQGLSLSNALPNGGNYSVETIFQFSNLSGYRRIIDFKDRTSDTGLYDFNTALNFYNVTTGSNNAFAPNTDVRLILTRDASTNLVVGYVNGVQQISFTDTTSLATFSGPNNVIHFFLDNLTGAFPGEVSAGSVDLIRIYNTPLTAAEVAALGGPSAVVTPVPEPGTLAVGAIMLGTFGCARRFGRQAGKATAA